ncbi:DDE superfamily endonuclease [Popillia japonica]|uniref:DDE superfamily endonuclease n=1 Tax=Popillia japonica TaxID=7064 RepID=A0AAW1HUD0_POPJA
MPNVSKGTYLISKGYDSLLDEPRRILNGDETCFLLGPKETKVLAPKGCKNVYEVDRAVAKANLTVMFTFSASGDTTPPMIIYPYKRLPPAILNSVPEEWGIPPMIIYPYKRLPPAILNSVPEEWGIGLSENGWMKAEIFFEYVSKVLHPYLVKNNYQFPVILFVDGHKSHLTLQVSELCEKLQIILIALYPNATRILQPADVGVFKPVKALWRRAVLQWRRENPNEQLTKEKFAPILRIVVGSIKPSIIVNGFKATGLYPFTFDGIDASKCLGKSTGPEEIVLQETIEETCSISEDRKLDYENLGKSTGPEEIVLQETIEETCSISEDRKLDYETFFNIVGPETIEKIESFANLESCNEKEDYFQILCKIWKYFKENKATDQYTTEENKNKNTTILNWEDIPIVTYQELLLDYSATAQQRNPNGSLSDGILSDNLLQEIEVEEIKDLNDNNQEQMELAGAYHKDLEKTDDRRIYEGGDMELTETNEDHLERNNNQNVNAPFGGEFMKGEIWN